MTPGKTLNAVLWLALLWSPASQAAPRPEPEIAALPGPGDGGPSSASRRPWGEWAPGDHDAELRHGGRRRVYHYHLPPAYEEKSLLPVVVVLAGGRGGAEGMKKITAGGFDRLADRHGFIALYPEYVENIWNDGRGVPTYYSQSHDVDDVGFISALIGRAVRDLKGDRRRVYLAGFSNGAMMAQRVACQLPDKIAAVSSVSGGIAPKVARKCRRSSSVSMLLIHGDKDAFMRWNEPSVMIAMAQAGERLTVPDTLKLWLRLERCPSKPRLGWLPDSDPDDGTRIRTSTYGPCRGGSEVALYEVQGGGHTWPGGGQWQPDFVVGAVSRDADASELSWDFFRRHTLDEDLP